MKINEEKIVEVVNDSKSMTEAAKRLGINYKTLRIYAKKMDIFKPNQSGAGINKPKIKLEDILANKVKFSTQQLKKRLLDENLIEYKCNKCGNKGFWFDNILVLELHHINGNDNDNRLENLEMLCPNCHSQTHGFRVKNKKVKNGLVL